MIWAGADVPAGTGLLREDAGRADAVSEALARGVSFWTRPAVYPLLVIAMALIDQRGGQAAPVGGDRPSPGRR